MLWESTTPVYLAIYGCCSQRFLCHCIYVCTSLNHELELRMWAGFHACPCASLPRIYPLRHACDKMYQALPDLSRESLGTRVLARPFPKGAVPFGFVTKETMCLLAPPQNQHYFNSHLNYLNLKTVWDLNIEHNEHWTAVKCFVDSGTHATNVWYWQLLHSRWWAYSWHYLCPLACKVWWERCWEWGYLST